MFHCKESRHLGGKVIELHFEFENSIGKYLGFTQQVYENNNPFY